MNLWKITDTEIRQLGPTESITLHMDNGTQIGPQPWPSLIGILEQANPTRTWLTAADLYVEHLDGADLGYGYAAPVIGQRDGLPVALRQPTPIPAPPADDRQVAAVVAELNGVIGQQAIARGDAAIAPDYLSRWEPARWTELYRQAIEALSNGNYGPMILAETQGMSSADAIARIEGIRAKGEAWVAFSAWIVNRRAALRAQVAAAAQPWTDYEAALAAYEAAVTVEDPQPPFPDVPDQETARLAALAALDALAPSLVADETWASAA